MARLREFEGSYVGQDGILSHLHFLPRRCMIVSDSEVFR